MQKFTLLLLGITLIMVISSCQKKEDNADAPATLAPAVEERRQQVMAVHDEVMPLMSDIYQAKRRLREAGTTSEPTAETKARANEVIILLDSADQGMRVWMREFSRIELDGMEEKDALGVLDREMKRIEKVKHDMQESLRQAEALNNESGSTQKDR